MNFSGDKFAIFVVLMLLASASLIWWTTGNSEVLEVIPTTREPEITIRFHSADSTEGEIVAAIFEDETSFRKRKDPLKRVRLKPDETETVQWIVEGVEPGDYVVAAFVDSNGNSKLDKNFLGIPQESYGFSNNPRGKFGPPKYEDCLFHFAESTDLEINLR